MTWTAPIQEFQSEDLPRFPVIASGIPTSAAGQRGEAKKRSGRGKGCR